MKVAIHHKEGSFSDRWIEYCQINKIDFILVNCYDNGIVQTLKNENVTHLMWHFSHSTSTDILISNYVFNSVEKLGIKTFPNHNTRWHFDDKCAQKYLFETLDIPYAKANIFYNKKEANNYLKTVSFPIVSKLRRGAGSTNVSLIHNLQEGVDVVDLMFDKGVASLAKPLGNLDQKVRLAKKIKDPIKLVSKVYSHFKKTNSERKFKNVEKGYVYFQEFMPGNDFDTRIIVVGNKAFAIRRFNKENDFRASGSGKIDYDTSKIDLNFVKEAFLATDKMEAQCLAYDFVYHTDNKPRIIEISFGFSVYAYDQCEGYWDKNLNFHREKFNPQFFMIQDLLESN